MGLKQKSRKRQRALDKVYEVEAIVDFRINEGKEQFFIKWKGYASVENTWESADVVNAPILIKKFWNQHPKFKNATKLSESTHELDTNTKLLKSQKNTLGLYCCLQLFVFDMICDGLDGFRVSRYAHV
ncbi:Chromobox protein 5, variant 2 [Batrachochytrium dendrobatidis]